MKENTPSFELGFWVGCWVVNTHLPYLSMDKGTTTTSTGKMVEILEWEQEHVNYLDGTMDALLKPGVEANDNPEWMKVFYEFTTFRKMLKVKYLPDHLIIPIPISSLPDKEEFKKGVKDALWDSDCSNYDVESEAITDSPIKGFIKLHLKLDL